MKLILQKAPLVLSFILIILLAALFFVRPQITPVTETASSSVEIKGQKISVILAKTPQEREQGLSGSSPLAPNTGMLFIFNEPGAYGFWMKDMNYPIDIVWIDEDKKVTHLVSDAQPESYPEVYTPTFPALYVLEVPAGFITQNEILLGDSVAITY